ncbi:MAG TPA: hypothetical protein VFF67_00730 [Thermoplasmata archaeon]|nr:hypothetical protein [Thermoplasmata archaeon]
MPAPPTAAMEATVLFAGAALAAVAACAYLLLDRPSSGGARAAKSARFRRSEGRVGGVLAVVLGGGAAAALSSLVVPDAPRVWELPTTVLLGAVAAWGLGQVAGSAERTVRRRSVEPPIDPMAPPPGDLGPTGALTAGAAIGGVTLLLLGGLFLGLGNSTVLIVGVAFGGAVGATASLVFSARRPPDPSGGAAGEAISPRTGSGGSGAGAAVDGWSAAVTTCIGTIVLAIAEPVTRTVVPSAVLYPLVEFAAVSLVVVAVGAGCARWSQHFGRSAGRLPILVASSAAGLAVLVVASSFGGSNTALAACGLVGVAAGGLLTAFGRPLGAPRSDAPDGRPGGWSGLLTLGIVVPLTAIAAYVCMGWAGSWGAVALVPALGAWGVGVAAVAAAGMASISLVYDAIEAGGDRDLSSRHDPSPTPEGGATSPRRPLAVSSPFGAYRIGTALLAALVAVEAFAAVGPTGDLAPSPLPPLVLTFTEPSIVIGFVVGVLLLPLRSRRSIRSESRAPPTADPGKGLSESGRVRPQRPGLESVVPGISAGAIAALLVWLLGASAVVGFAAGIAGVGFALVIVDRRQHVTADRSREGRTNWGARVESRMVEAVRWSSAVALVFGSALLAEMPHLG